MKCNFKKVMFKKGLMKHIVKNMNYKMFLDNTAVTSETTGAHLPQITRKLQVKCPSEHGQLVFFLQYTPISEEVVDNIRFIFVPITSDLLELYGVSPEQFINDFFEQDTITTLK